MEGRVSGREGMGWDGSRLHYNPPQHNTTQHNRPTMYAHTCLGVVEGHLGEDVVADVGVGDVVEGVVEQPPEGAVHGAERAAEPGPLLLWLKGVGVRGGCVLRGCTADRKADRQRGREPMDGRTDLAAEVGDEDVRVLEVGDEDEVVVDDHVGDEVVLGDGPEAEGGHAVHDGGERGEEAEVGPEDVQAVLGREELGVGREVVVHLPLLCLLWVVVVGVGQGTVVGRNVCCVQCREGRREETETHPVLAGARGVEDEVAGHPPDGQHDHDLRWTLVCM